MTPVVIPDTPLAFATSADVATRLGRALTEAETAQIDGALGDVAQLIRQAGGKAADWMPATTVPRLLRSLSIEKAIGVIVNPHNLASESEQLGAYQHSQTFPRSADIGIFLSDDERRQVRRAIYGTNAASVRPPSLVDDLRRADSGQITVVDSAEETASA